MILIIPLEYFGRFIVENDENQGLMSLLIFGAIIMLGLVLYAICIELLPKVILIPIITILCAVLYYFLYKTLKKWIDQEKT